MHKADAFAPLAALPSLASLDLGRCDLEALPPLLGTLPALRTLLLADNMLGALRPTGVVDAAAAGPSAGAAPAPGGAVLPPQLVHLDLAGNLLTASPADALPTQLTSLDLSRCYKLFMQPEDWRRLLLALPFLCLLRHSDPLLMMAKPASGGLRLEQHPPASVPGTKRAYSCGSMEALEQGAAAALLGGGTMGGSDGDVRGDGDGGDGGGLAQLLAAAASSSGS